MANSENKVLTEKELADVLGLSVWTVRGMRLKEGCPHFTVGSRIFYRLETVLAWISSREQSQQIQEPAAQEFGRIRQIR